MVDLAHIDDGVSNGLDQLEHGCYAADNFHVDKRAVGSD